MRLRCVVAYDGTGFSGWQRQARGRSVQADLEVAIGRISGAISRVSGSSRTDSGVHAIGQVAHFDCEWARPVDSLERAINAVLPQDVAISRLAVAPDAFHARHDATGRQYRYVIATDAGLGPLLGRTALVWTGRLDIGALADGAGRLIGMHDFGGFGQPMSADGATVRRMKRVAVHAVGSCWVLEFEADAFLRHQVRRMVGLLLDVGSGRLAVDSVDQVLARTAGAPLARRAPARGLILWAVSYPPDERPWPGQRHEGVSGEDLHA